mgnify:CR=1 FL=1
MAEKVCECGAVYEVGQQKLPVRDKDTYNCDVCGEELDRWNASNIPTYTLIQRPDGK